MDLNRVFYFVTVVEAGSYTAAGERLRVPKSTLSRHVKALEDELQIRLLNRSTRQLSLTRSGERFFKDCLPLITHLQNAHAQLADERERVSGHLRVTMPSELALVFLSRVLAEFLKHHSQIFLDLDMSHQNQDLIQDNYDLALRIGHLADSSYIARRLATMKTGLYASVDYLNRHGRPTSLEDLTQHDILFLGGLEKQVTWFGEALAKRLRSQLNSNNVLFNLSMCQQGVGISILPEAIASPSVEAGQLEPILPNVVKAETNLYAVYPSRKHPSKAMMAFIEFVSKKLEEMPISGETLSRI